MRKRVNLYLLIFMVLFISPSLLFSQYRYWNYNKLHVSLQGGLAWPFDRFGTGHNVKYASWVNKGYNITLQGAYFYSPNYGVGMNFILNAHNVNKEKLEQAYLDSPAYLSATANVGSFYIPVVTAGMFFQVPLSEYFAFTGAIHAGVQTVVKPPGEVIVTTRFSTISYKETGAVQANFVIYYKFGMQIRVANGVHIMLDAAYTGSTYMMEYYRNDEKITEPQHIGDVMYRLGVAYKFE